MPLTGGHSSPSPASENLKLEEPTTQQTGSPKVDRRVARGRAELQVNSKGGLQGAGSPEASSFNSREELFLRHWVFQDSMSQLRYSEVTEDRIKKSLHTSNPK